MQRPLFICLLILFTLTFYGCEEAQSSESKKETTSEVEVENNDQNGVEAVPEKQLTFAERIGVLCDTLFSDYRDQDMQIVDRFPKFKRANQSIYRRFRRKDPIKIDINPRVYPRLTLKAFRFGDEKSALAAVEEWLNEMESSEDQIELGKPVEALKSPPYFCAVLGTQFIAVQSSCLYQHASYDEMRNRFFGWVLGQEDVRFAWEITCSAGKIEYRFGEIKS